MGLREDIAAMRSEIRRLKAQIAQRPLSPLAGGYRRTTAFLVKQAAHGLAVNDPVRHDGAGWIKSTADTAGNSVVAGIVVDVVSADAFVLATGGQVSGLTGLTAGAVHYLATAGGLTTTAPTIAIPILLADSATGGVLLSLGQGGGGVAPTEDGTVFCSNSGGTAGEWVMTVDIGRNAVGKAGKIQILSPDAGGVAIEIDAALVTSSAKKLTIREADVCVGGAAMKVLRLESAPY